MSARSAILKKVETTWVSGKIYQIFRCFNAKTSVQITFLANLTGILVFLTYDHHVAKNEVSFFEKIPYLKNTYPFWLKIDGFLLLRESNMFE